MGIITMALVSAGSIDEFNVPRWVVAASAAVLSLGTSLGGWRLIRTLGGKFYKIRPVHGFATQVSSAAVVLTAALLGGPVSTTHVVSSAILGVGSAERKNMVRWQAAGNIILAWVMTIPISGLIGALAYLLLSLVI
jgi:PiT family inorganic phosphate transporter